MPNTNPTLGELDRTLADVEIGLTRRAAERARKESEVALDALADMVDNGCGCDEPGDDD